MLGRTRTPTLQVAGIWLALLVTQPAYADKATIAIAANFTNAMQSIAESFESHTSHELILVFGSTGQLYAQIINGAPFHAYLAADQRRPQLLVANGFADGATQITYAVGELVLWSRDAGLLVNTDLQILKSDRYRHLAIANPDLAPYGAAARDVLMRLNLWHSLDGRVAFAQSIGQAYAMVATGNAELGLVARSQVIYRGQGATIAIPREFYSPILQDAVLLERGRRNEAAVAMMQFLSTMEAQTIIENAGYSSARDNDP